MQSQEQKLRRFQNVIKPKGEGKRTISAKDFIEYRHRFMCVYGWIPLTEWKNIKFPEFWDLAHKVNKHLEDEEEKRIQLHETIIQAMTGKKPKRQKHGSKRKS